MAAPATNEEVARFNEIQRQVRDELADRDRDDLLAEIALMRVRQESAGSRTGPASWVDRLREPLDQSRVRTRDGRGNTKLSYLAGHDVIRTANEIFGFGRWSSEVVECVEDAVVSVKSGDRDGWHVAYRAVVRVTVSGCLPVSDVGYGDGVEYGPAAIATARELAMKEAVTDAMKRALRLYGDQFGLILYAKDDERRRIESDRNADQATARTQQAAGKAKLPTSWAEIKAIADAYDPSLGWSEWVKDAAEAIFGSGKRDLAALTAEQKRQLSVRTAKAIVALSDAHGPGLFPPPTREEVAQAWAAAMEGAILPGPVWQMSPEEAELGIPTYYEANGLPAPERPAVPLDDNMTEPRMTDAEQ